MGQSCCAQHTFDTHEMDNLARTRYMKTHPNCEIEKELTSLTSELLEIAIRKTRLRKRKFVLITAATSAIGRSLCSEFASKSSEYIVCGIANDNKHVQQMTDDLDKISSTINTLKDESESEDKKPCLQRNESNVQCVDVCNEKKVALWIMDVFEQFGIPDLIINNSTIIAEANQNGLGYEEFVRMSDEYTIAYFHLLKYVMPALIIRKKGIIINLTGTSDSIPTVFKAAYENSKFAMEGYVESLCEQLFTESGYTLNIFNFNISFITMSVGPMDMIKHRILCGVEKENTLKQGLLSGDKMKEKEERESVTFQRWAAKSMPIICSLLDEKKKKKQKYSQYTSIDRIVDLNTMLKEKYNQ